MEAGEENGCNFNLKRQRAPLSDSEDNVSSPSGKNDSQKRRRLEAAGQENCSPKASSSGRQVELDMKPDTPMVPSVRSRVQQFTQRREGGAPLAQRCLSDPGADSPSVIIYEKAFREHLLGEGEFHQRLERFKVPVFQVGPNPTPGLCNPSPRTRSNFVSAIQQKLNDTPAASSKQVSRMRQEREQELKRFHFQPISENAWLKRSSSDPSLSQQIDGDAEMKDGSFTEAPISGEEKQPLDGTGERVPTDSEDSESSYKGKQHMIWKAQDTHRSDEVSEENGHEKQQAKQPQIQTVLKLSFSSNESFPKKPYTEDQKVSERPKGEKQSLLESYHEEESNITGTMKVSKVTEHAVSAVFEDIESPSHSEEEIEPSTDEESRLWRYPQDKVFREEESITAEEVRDGELNSSNVAKEKRRIVAEHCEPSDNQDGQGCLDNVYAEIAVSSEIQQDENPRFKEESESNLNDTVKDQSNINGDQGNLESPEGIYNVDVSKDIAIFTVKQDHKDTEGCPHRDDLYQQSMEIQTVDIKETEIDLDSDSVGPNSRIKPSEASPSENVIQALMEKQTSYSGTERNIDEIAKPKGESQAELLDTDGNDGTQILAEVQVSDKVLETEEMEQDAVDPQQGVVDGLTDKISKKVTFILEPELINDAALSKTSTSMESREEACMSGENSKKVKGEVEHMGEKFVDAELSSHDETNTAEIIDQMFEEVLEYAGRIQDGGDDEDTEDHDSGIGVCSGDKDKMDTESEKEKSEEEGDSKEKKCYENEKLDSNRDELLFPPSGILSPLSKSVEAVVTPLRLAASEESNPPSLLLTPEEITTPPPESAPLYSIDAYRTQRQSKQPPIQSVTPGVQRKAPQKSQPQPSVNTKEKIMALNEEAGKLQTVINQTLQALSCCTDEEHGRGSLEEAEAEKLLLVSCERRSALLAEVGRLREERNLESEEDKEYVSQQACRGTVSITNIQLPLKVEFVCSSHNRTGRPSHYFFILIRYGPCNIIATPLATAADAQNGDTILFPTTVTLKDIRSSFEIDVEVYSLSHTSGSNSSMDRTTNKSRVTPRKLLNTITRSSNSLMAAAPPALNTRRSSNFCLVGSHKITLASLGHSKFPLDKMKLEGKIRRLLGDEFQEKVPFLSPLEGNIYLCLESESHSDVHHQGFLTMFELSSGYGVWHRRYFVLAGCNMYYWNYPNDRETKEAEGSISLSSSPGQCVRPVKRDSCARPFTFELVSNIPQQQDTLTKCWFSADTKQERLDWMEKLSQTLLDFHTWNRISANQTESRQSNVSSSGSLRESIL